MNYRHKSLANGRWFEFSLIEQLANMGREVGRAIDWRDKDRKISEGAVERALELIYLSVEDPKNRGRLKEILRLREALL